MESGRVLPKLFLHASVHIDKEGGPCCQVLQSVFGHINLLATPAIQVHEKQMPSHLTAHTHNKTEK